MFNIVDKKVLNENVVQMTVSAPLIAAKVKPGQFVIIRIDERGERIPLTISDYDRENGTVNIIVQAVGFTTKLLAALNAGDGLLDVVGPLGRPTELDGIKKAVVVGGGVGNAIAYPQAKALFHCGATVDIVAGFRSKDIVILEKEMSSVCRNLYITTDDGTYGIKGFVTEVLEDLLKKEEYDAVIAIGPVPMMKFVCRVTKPFGVKTIVSLNPIMIDGTGMCGGCRVLVGGETKFACVDGPDFDGHQVDFDDLMRRGGAYREQENHYCRLEGK